MTSRGNERKPIYKDDKDREIFLDILKKVNERYNWLCHAYCLKDNHYHLVIETPDGNLSRGMRELNGVYTQVFNKRHNRVGHVFQGRYKAILVDKESHLLVVCRYVILNPLGAKAAKRPEDWKWSSYRATAGLESPHLCLTTEWILGQFGAKRGLAKQRYRDFVKAGIGEETIWSDVRGQIILGGDDFIGQLIAYVKGREDIKEIPRSQRYVDRPHLAELFNGDIVKDKRSRDKKIKEAVERYGYSQREVADYLGMHYSTISRLVNGD